jgi:hypothetical protein
MIPALSQWEKVSVRDQIGHVGAELLRASAAKDPDARRLMLERALALVDLSLEDQKWRESRLALLRLRDEIAAAYTDTSRDPIHIYAAL